MNKYIKKFRENIAKLDEDAKKDYQLIKEAEVVYNEFLKDLQKKMELVLKELKLQENSDYCMVGYLTIKLDIYNDSYSDGSYDPFMETIHLSLNSLKKKTKLKNVEINPNTVNESIIYTILNSNFTKEVFLHEYQHYKYDQYRYPNLTQDLKSIKFPNGGTYYDYRHDANENNSYIIEELNNIIKKFKKEINNNLSKNDIKNKLNYFISDLYNQYINTDINPKEVPYDPKSSDLSQFFFTYNKKRYINRIYNLLYYLFVEGNVDNAKKIYNEIKRNINESSDKLEEDTTKLTEAKIIKIDLNNINYNSSTNYMKYIQIYKNPTKTEIDILLKKSIDKELRGLAINNDIYVWDSHFGIHTDILDALKNIINISNDTYIADFLYLNDKNLEAGYTQYKNNYYIKDINLTKNIMLNNKKCLEIFSKDKINKLLNHQDWDLEEAKKKIKY